jgi:hypothetical protein
MRVVANKMVGIRLRSYDRYLNDMPAELAEFMMKSLCGHETVGPRCLDGSPSRRRERLVGSRAARAEEFRQGRLSRRVHDVVERAVWL